MVAAPIIIALVISLPRKSECMAALHGAPGLQSCTALLLISWKICETRQGIQALADCQLDPPAPAYVFPAHRLQSSPDGTPCS